MDRIVLINDWIFAKSHFFNCFQNFKMFFHKTNFETEISNYYNSTKFEIKRHELEITIQLKSYRQYFTYFC